MSLQMACNCGISLLNMILLSMLESLVAILVVWWLLVISCHWFLVHPVFLLWWASVASTFNISTGSFPPHGRGRHRSCVIQQIGLLVLKHFLEVRNVHARQRSSIGHCFPLLGQAVSLFSDELQLQCKFLLTLFYFFVQVAHSLLLLM